MRSPPSPIPDSYSQQKRKISSYRRVSDASSSVSSRSSSSVKMTRNLSRQSSPPVMVTSTSPRTYSPPPPSPHTPKRSSSPRYASQLRKSQDAEKPKWHF
jgi:hypothetical protein